MLLEDQDRTRWDGVAISRADGYLGTAASLRRPGRFQLQAALAGCHASAATWAETDWLQILTLYDMLLRHDPSPVIRLNQAIALSGCAGPRRRWPRSMRWPIGWPTITCCTPPGRSCSTGWVTMRRRGPRTSARSALTDNPAEQELLRSRLRSVADPVGAGGLRRRSAARPRTRWSSRRSGIWSTWQRQSSPTMPGTVSLCPTIRIRPVGCRLLDLADQGGRCEVAVVGGDRDLPDHSRGSGRVLRSAVVGGVDRHAGPGGQQVGQSAGADLHRLRSAAGRRCRRRPSWYGVRR